MKAFGGAGVGRPDTPAEIAERARRNALAERARIARLTADDVARIMARVIVQRAAQTGAVERADFLRAGIPDRRIDFLLDDAFAVARRLEPGLDRMVQA